MAEKVLVVDDEDHIRELLASFLAGEGYKVILASNGKEAIDLAKREDPKLILLDLKMPGTGGIEACKRLKANKKTRLIPLIMMTGLSDRKAEAFEARADDFVNKPFDLTDIKVRVKSLIRVGHLTDPAVRLTAYTEELENNISK
jgi:DNA-binding response OmpR family regulator